MNKPTYEQIICWQQSAKQRGYQLHLAFREDDYSLHFEPHSLNTQIHRLLPILTCIETRLDK